MIDPDSLKRGTQAAAYVTQMAVITVLGGALGRWLDTRWHTGPWLSLLGFTGGFAIGMVALFHGLTRLQRDDDPEPPDPAE